MKISKLALVALLGGALMAVGCGDDDGNGGGTGGTAGTGGTGGTGGIKRCESVAVDPIEECCERGTPPDQANACDGTESLDNPETCPPSGNATVTHLITVLAVDGDCDQGYNLDGVDGPTCASGTIYAGEGLDGVDNQLAALGPTLEVAEANLSGVDKAFSDALCGLADDPAAGTCEGGDNEGDPCTMDGGECTGAGAMCNLDDDDCGLQGTPLELRLEVDANPAENCAIVTVSSNGVESDPVFLNISEPSDGTVCASGTLGAIPITLVGVEGTLGNAVVRMTVSPTGFSDGLLGATVDEDTAVTIAEIISDVAGPLVPELLDIRNDLMSDTEVECEALSVALKIGGVAEAQ